MLSESSTIFTSGKDGIFPPGIPIGKANLNDSLIEVELYSSSSQTDICQYDFN